MSTLQQALQAIGGIQPRKAPPAAKKPATGRQRTHSVPVGTFDTPRIAVFGEFDRPSKSEAPPERENNFAERYFEERVPCK